MKQFLAILVLSVSCLAQVGVTAVGTINQKQTGKPSHPSKPGKKETSPSVSNRNQNAANATQAQGQETTSTMTGGNTSVNENVAAPKIPVSTAYAPTAIPTAPCVKGYGAGAQTAPFGISFGGDKVDKNCQALETARYFAEYGSRLAACKVLISTDAAKKAGVTLEDCVGTPTPVVEVTTEVIPPAPELPVVVVRDIPTFPLVVYGPPAIPHYTDQQKKRIVRKKPAPKTCNDGWWPPEHCKDWCVSAN